MHLSSVCLCFIDIAFLCIVVGLYALFRWPFCKLLFLIGIFILFGNFYCNSLFTNKLSHFRCCKNVELILHVDSVTEKPETQTVYGYAKVFSAPEKLSPILKQMVYFILTTDKPEICSGQKIRVSCKLVHTSPNARKAFSKFLFKNHVFWYCCDGEILGVLSAASKFQQFCSHARSKIFAWLELGISDRPQSGILVGMLTGAKYKISRLRRTDFCSAGVAHIFAISGLHIGLIAIFLDKILRIFLINKKLRAFPVVGILGIYVNVIGASPSSVRAYLMVMFYYAAILFNRRPNVVSAFANSAFVHILCRPVIVYNISFLLSYCVVFGIIMLAYPLNIMLRNLLFSNEIRNFRDINFLSKISLSCKKYFLENICVSLAACIASLAISLEFFGQISWLTMLFNIVVIPLASTSIILGSLSIFCGILHLWTACEYINNLAIVPIILVEKCFDMTRAIHHGSISYKIPLSGLWLLTLLAIAYTGHRFSQNRKHTDPQIHDSDFCSAKSFNLRS